MLKITNLKPVTGKIVYARWSRSVQRNMTIRLQLTVKDLKRLGIYDDVDGPKALVGTRLQFPLNVP